MELYCSERENTYNNLVQKKKCNFVADFWAEGKRRCFMY